MLSQFFALAVIGPFAGPRFGVAEACCECTARNAPRLGECGGFGSGCLGARRPAHDQDASSDITR